MAPSGHHLGDRGDSPSLLLSFRFPARWAGWKAQAETLLLTQPLRDSFNSSLSMAPVIEPSERQKGEKRSLKTERREVEEQEVGEKAGNSIVILELSHFQEPVILPPYWWDGCTWAARRAAGELQIRFSKQRTQRGYMGQTQASCYLEGHLHSIFQT